MLVDIFTDVFNWAVNLVDSWGYWGIYVGMMIESSGPPIPSEFIMGFAGYLVYLGRMNLWLAGLVGALGNITGSMFLYTLGIKGGRPILDKYGKYLDLTPPKVARMDQWFAKWGDEIVFVAQFLPGVRTYITLPAGVVKVNFPKFVVYTFAGSFIWCTSLAYIAMKLGENWGTLSEQVHVLQNGVVVGLLLLMLYGTYILIRNRRRTLLK